MKNKYFNVDDRLFSFEKFINILGSIGNKINIIIEYYKLQRKTEYGDKKRVDFKIYA